MTTEYAGKEQKEPKRIKASILTNFTISVIAAGISETGKHNVYKENVDNEASFKLFFYQIVGPKQHIYIYNVLFSTAAERLENDYFSSVRCRMSRNFFLTCIEHKLILGHKEMFGKISIGDQYFP